MTRKESLKAVIKAAKTASLATMFLLAIYSYFSDMPSNLYIILGLATVGFIAMQFIYKRLH